MDTSLDLHLTNPNECMKKISSILFVLLCLISITSCEKKCTCDNTSYQIGDNYGGGIIAYVDNTGKHGLIVSTADLADSGWGCKNSVLGATAKTVGSGLTNTNAIVSNCSDVSSAAKKCSDLVLNGYSDWFLPTIDELDLMYKNLHLKGKGNFATSLPYWSSSEANATDQATLNVTPSLDAWRIGMTAGGWTCTDKNGLAKVRPCRYF